MMIMSYWYEHITFCHHRVFTWYISETWYAFLSDFVYCTMQVMLWSVCERAWHTHTHTQSIRRHYINHLCVSSWMRISSLWSRSLYDYDRPLSNLFLYFDIKKMSTWTHIFQYSIHFAYNKHCDVICDVCLSKLRDWFDSWEWEKPFRYDGQSSSFFA